MTIVKKTKTAKKTGASVRNEGVVDAAKIARIRAKTRPHDSSRYLKTEEDMATYLEAALEIGNPQGIIIAIGNIVKARNVQQLAKETGLNRTTLYTALGPDGNPEFSTILKVIKALGLQLHAAPAV